MATCSGIQTPSPRCVPSKSPVAGWTTTPTAMTMTPPSIPARGTVPKGLVPNDQHWLMRGHDESCSYPLQDKVRDDDIQNQTNNGDDQPNVGHLLVLAVVCLACDPNIQGDNQDGHQPRNTKKTRRDRYGHNDPQDGKNDRRYQTRQSPLPAWDDRLPGCSPGTIYTDIGLALGAAVVVVNKFGLPSNVPARSTFNSRE